MCWQLTLIQEGKWQCASVWSRPTQIMVLGEDAPRRRTNRLPLGYCLILIVLTNAMMFLRSCLLLPPGSLFSSLAVQVKMVLSATKDGILNSHSFLRYQDHPVLSFLGICFNLRWSYADFRQLVLIATWGRMEYFGNLYLGNQYFGNQHFGNCTFWQSFFW